MWKFPVLLIIHDINALIKRNWTQKYSDTYACGVIGSESHGKIVYFVLYNNYWLLIIILMCAN